VVDNKSSGKKPEPSKMEDGEQLQLMIYLKAATAAFPGARPAGAFFFPVQDAEIQAEETPEALEAERMKKARMKGLVNAREDVVRAMDRDLQPYSVDGVFNKDGSVRKNADWAVEEDVLRGLMAAAEEKAAEICGGIRAGRIDVKPRGKSEEDAPCRFCSYRTLCRRSRDSLTPRKEETTFRSLAGKNTLRDAEK
jgi:ATP-dependent helicase/DNAse subunit B